MRNAGWRRKASIEPPTSIDLEGGLNGSPSSFNRSMCERPHRTVLPMPRTHNEEGGPLPDRLRHVRSSCSALQYETLGQEHTFAPHAYEVDTVRLCVQIHGHQGHTCTDPALSDLPARGIDHFHLQITQARWK
jgi:hypothetical protein